MMSICRLSLALLCGVFFSLGAGAGDAEFVENREQFASRVAAARAEPDPEKRMNALKELYDQGSMVAGLHYSAGISDGVSGPADPERGLAILRPLVDKGFSAAQVIMALTLINAKLPNPDPVEAKRLFALAAEQNNPAGQYWLGMMMLKDMGDQKNTMVFHQAMGWLRLSANQGDEKAKEAVAHLEGLMRSDRNEEPFADSGLSFQSVIDEAERGKAEAQYALGYVYFEPEYGYLDLDKAIHWFEKAAENGNDAAQSNLGNIFGSVPTVKDMRKSVYWHEKAAAQGNTTSMQVLGGLYGSGMGVEEDIFKARDYFIQLHALDPAEGLRGLNALYATGSTPPGDSTAKFDWYRDGAERGAAEAQFRLGLLYALGDGTPMDFVASARWLEKAADQNHPAAQKFLGDLYSDGRGVERNPYKARELYRKSRDSGYEDATQEAIDRLDNEIREMEAAAAKQEDTGGARKTERASRGFLWQ